MDNIDKKILHLLQENAGYPLKHLASKVFLSSPAVSARIERLEKSGIISGYHASVAPVSLGYHITAFRNRNSTRLSRRVRTFWSVTALPVHTPC